MKLRHTGRNKDEKVELQMTPMVDVVFLLLIFFILTFRIVTPEGDFNIKMPSVMPQQKEPDELNLPPIKVHLRANENGDLVSLRMGEKPVPGNDMKVLQQWVIEMVERHDGPSGDQEFELECDFNLKYVHTMDAVTAISGYRRDDRIISLIEKIKFTPPKPPKI